MKKTLRLIVCGATLLTPGPTAVWAQAPIPVDTASAGGYVRAAAYFHYRELAFRARAQSLLDSYSIYLGKCPMATKTVTREEALERQYNQYLSRANENARLAATYDHVLEHLGYKPAALSKEVVSVKELHEIWNGVFGNE